MTALRLYPISRADANAFVRLHHRHNKRRPAADLFRVACADGDRMVGVAIIGNPSSRVIQAREPQTCELRRLCMIEGAPTGAASMLIGAVRRAAWALGYTRMISYTLKREAGTSMRAAGFHTVAEIKGRRWNTPSRPRTDGHAIEDRLLWEDVAA